MLNKLIFANLTHRPVRTLLSVLASLLFLDLVLIPGHIWDFDWSPDSTRLAAVVIDGSTADIQVLGIADHAWTTVATMPITIDGPDTIDGLGPIKKIGWAG